MEPLFDPTSPPERVGPYRIDRAIGRGGMGMVWRAWDERLKRQVAIKQIRSYSPLRTLQQRLWREAQAAARLNHPAIVHVYDLVEDAAGAWIVMELVAGRTLRDLTDEQGPLPFAQAARLGLDVAEGLAEEDLAEAMASLQALAGEVCERFSGQVGATLGHRLWLYFGYPQALGKL